MEMVFTQLPMNPSVSDSHSSRHSCFPYIPVSTLFQSAPGTSIGHTHLCVRYTPSDSRKHIACVSRCFSDIPSLSSTTIHTKKYPPHGEARPVKISFPSSYIPGHNSWFLRLKRGKISKWPENSSALRITSTSSPLHPPAPTQDGGGIQEKQLPLYRHRCKKGPHSPERPQSAQDTSSSGRPLFLFMLEPPKQKSQ